MKCAQRIDELSKETGRVALTIGTFDGVHRGHKEILTALKKAGKAYLITFATHPLTLLSTRSPLAITTLSHKLALLEKEGIDRCYLLQFTEAFAKQSAREFLTELKKHLNFTSLILGHDAKIGYQRQGDKECLRQLAQELHFHLEYIPPYSIHEKVISSSLIRHKIETNALEEASLLLERPYSIVSETIEGAKKGRIIGYPTANLNIQGLVLPKLGVWACYLVHKNKQYQAIANLGHAPTFYQDRPCLLEIHILDKEAPTSLYGESVEVIFKQYLRPEKQFVDSNELKQQIITDISFAQKIL